MNVSGDGLLLYRDQGSAPAQSPRASLPRFDEVANGTEPGLSRVAKGVVA